MAAYTGAEKRKYPRVNCHFLVSYSPQDSINNTDTSQIKNISSGGALFTACQLFEKDSKLALKIRLPVARDPLSVTAKIIECHEIVKGLIYDTRLEFLPMDEYSRGIISAAIDFCLKRKIESN